MGIIGGKTNTSIIIVLSEGKVNYSGDFSSLRLEEREEKNSNPLSG